MKVRIANLPPDAGEDDIRGLLEESEDIRDVELVTEGDDDSPVAIVDMDGDAAGEAAIRLLNGRKWKDATLRADRVMR